MIAGLGNIYVCEALWRAGCRRARAAGTLVRGDGKPTERLERLVEAVRAVIADAIEAGGSSLRDYVQANGELGLFQHRFAVYDREDEPCLRRATGRSAASCSPAARPSIARSASAEVACKSVVRPSRLGLRPRTSG